MPATASSPAARSSASRRPRARRPAAVAVLDELTTGLDPHARRDAWALIERLKDAPRRVLVSHFMDEVERLCDRVAVIHRGRVVALDQPANLAQPGHLEDAFVELTTA